MTAIAHLKDRRLLRMTGSDASHFLQNLITCDVENLAEGELAYGALLTPQGKVQFAFFIQQRNDRFIIDAPAQDIDALAQRLLFYRLRADVKLAHETELKVAAVWSDESGVADAQGDPRVPALGDRLYAVTLPSASENETAYNAHRISCGVPEIGLDYGSSDVFPHEILLDQFDTGVAFTKGCYVGQEVVSRMQHRGTARRRFVHVTGESGLPAMGTELVASERTIGTIGSSAGTRGLALVRLDRAKRAMDDGVELLADGVRLSLSLPAFATFGWGE